MNTPKDTEILEKVRAIATDILKASPETITLETRFEDDLGADSLDKVTLLMALEEEFGEEISDEEAAELTSVGAVVTFVKNKMAAQ